MSFAVADAGYDVTEAPKVFAALQMDAREDGVEEPYFFGNHPRLQERIDNYKAAIDAWHPPAGVAPRVDTEPLNRAVGALRLLDVRLDLAHARYQHAQLTARHQLQHDPNNAEAHFLLGEALRRGSASKDDQLAALLAYKKATEIDTKHAAAFRELGLLYQQLGDAGAASTALVQYIQLEPNAIDRPIIQHYIAADGAKDAHADPHAK